MADVPPASSGGVDQASGTATVRAEAVDERAKTVRTQGQAETVDGRVDMVDRRAVAERTADVPPASNGGVDQVSGTATVRAEALDERAKTVHTQGQTETVDGRVDMVDRRVVAERTEQAVYERVAAADGEEQQTVEQGGGAVCVQSSLTTTAESGEVTGERAVERVRIRWGSNNSKKYDGKVEDVPAQWVTDGSVAVGGTVRVNVEEGRTWAGTVIELFYQQNPLDLALPIKRTRHKSPASCTCC